MAIYHIENIKAVMEQQTNRLVKILNEAITLGVEYIKKKDFQINSFLQDTENLCRLTVKL